MITLKEMKKRISNKYTVLPLLYSYQYLNDIKNECIFYEIGESDDETDDLAKQAEGTLITLFGHDDFAAFNTTCQFIATFEEQEAIHAKITDKWRAKAKAYILDYLETEQCIKNGYFFMFVPKSL